jgi:hypothetical protein
MQMKIIDGPSHHRTNRNTAHNTLISIIGRNYTFTDPFSYWLLYMYTECTIHALYNVQYRMQWREFDMEPHYPRG